MLLCRKPTPGAPNQFYRGMNLEVSMPTGTLCAERNAIGEFVRSDRLLRKASLHTCPCALIRQCARVRPDAPARGHPLCGGVLRPAGREPPHEP